MESTLLKKNGELHLCSARFLALRYFAAFNRGKALHYFEIGSTQSCIDKSDLNLPPQLNLPIDF